MTSVTSDEISFTRKNQSEAVRRDGVSQIHHLRRKAEKGKYAAIGAGIGAGAGSGIGLARNHHRSMTALCLGRLSESACLSIKRDKGSGQSNAEKPLDVAQIDLA